jgi:metal-responsive CopG/Arc/MetJ family transcriptional regulator
MLTDNMVIHIKVDRPLVDQVDDFRREQHEIPSRAEAMRHLMRSGLKREARRKANNEPVTA